MNPAGFVEGFIAVAEDGEIAAYYGAIPEFYVMDGIMTTIYQSCDTMTKSNHRRKGLFEKLALHCYDYLKNTGKLFVYGFGGKQSTPGLIKFGWSKIADVKYYFIPRFFAARQTKKIENVSEITDYSDIENLILKSNSQAKFHSEKSLDVFKWRLSNPLHKYHVIAYRSSNSNGAYTSYLSYYWTSTKIVIFDFYFSDHKGGRELIRYLKSLLVEYNYIGIIAFCQSNTFYSRQLQKIGFVFNPFNIGSLSIKVPFMIITDKKLPEYNDARNWLINSFDHDAT